MKTREQKEEERRQREAAWIAEDEELKRQADPTARVVAEAREAWEALRSIFIVRTNSATNQLRWGDNARADGSLATLVEEIERVGWRLDQMSHYVTRDQNVSECGVFLFRRG